MLSTLQYLHARYCDCFYDEVPTRSARHVFQHGALEYPINSDRLKIGEHRTCLALHEPLLPFWASCWLWCALRYSCITQRSRNPSPAGWACCSSVFRCSFSSSGSATSPLAFRSLTVCRAPVALRSGFLSSFLSWWLSNGSLAALLYLSTVSKWTDYLCTK